jgi:hypothetical protein
MIIHKSIEKAKAIKSKNSEYWDYLRGHQLTELIETQRSELAILQSFYDSLMDRVRHLHSITEFLTPEQKSLLSQANNIYQTREITPNPTEVATILGVNTIELSRLSNDNQGLTHVPAGVT